ncbi:MAG: serine hydroxymethyltransferase [bacterium]|nr:serine hydroxymethyltransferase [bacterium]
MLKHVWETDPEVAQAIYDETERQEHTLEMIASENMVSEAVLEAQGSILTNKYAEGYPGRRYYGGCENVDVIENLARQRACAIFGADHANVQPHSGSQANMAAYYSVAKHGDTILGLSLAHGGHLTHGHKVNFSGSHFNVIQYGLDRETERIDYEEMRRLALEYKPRVLLAGSSAYPREIDFAPFRAVADEIGAIFMVDMAHFAGLVAAGLHQNPVPLADIVTTTTHKTLRGPRGGMILCKESLAKAVDKIVFPGYQGGPLEHVIAAKAVALKEAQQDSFKEYQRHIVENARALAKVLADGGARLISGGTDTHLILVDVTPLGLTGRDAENALHNAGITVNKNAIPYDTNPPAVASGIRMGTPALTSRGMGVKEMEKIGGWILDILKAPQDEQLAKKVLGAVKEMCLEFPKYASHLESDKK